MNAMPVDLPIIKAALADGRRAVVGTTQAGEVWIRAIGPEDIEPIDGTGDRPDYASIIESGGRFEIGGDVPYPRWTNTIDRAYVAACDMLARANAEAAQMPIYGLVLQINGSRTARARLSAHIKQRWDSKTDPLISRARPLRIVGTDDMTVVTALINTPDVSMVDALVRRSRQAGVVANIVTEGSDAYLTATYEGGVRLADFQKSPLHRGLSKFSVTGPTADVDRFERETAMAEPDDAQLYALHMVEGSRWRNGAGGLVLIHNHTDVRSAPVMLEMLASRYQKLRFDVSIVPQDRNEPCLVGEIEGKRAKWRPLSHDELRDFRAHERPSGREGRS